MPGFDGGVRRGDISGRSCDVPGIKAYKADGHQGADNEIACRIEAEVIPEPASRLYPPE